MPRIPSPVLAILFLLQAFAGISQADPPALTQEERSALTVPSAIELVYELRSTSEPDSALPYAEWAAENAPMNAEAWGSLGLVLFDLDRLDEALAAADEALAIDRNQQQALDVRSRVCLSKGRFAEALATARRLIAVAPDESIGYYCRGTAYHNLGQAALAAADYRRVVEFEPESAVALHNLGVSLLDAGKYEESLAAVSRSLEIDPTRASTMAERAQVLLKLGRKDEALKQYEAALATDAELAREYGTDELQALFEQQRTDSSDHDADGEESPEIKVAREYTERALAAYKAGKNLEAIGLISKALDAHYEFAPAHFVLGLTKEAEEDFTGAAVDFEYAMDLEPENDVFAGFAGFANLCAGLHEDALKCLDRAVRIAPNCLAHRDTRAKVYCQLGRYQDMVQDTAVAIEINPDSAVMQNCHAWALLQLGKPIVALRHVQNSLNLQPGDADALHTRGEVYRALGAHDLAIADFEAALKIDPTLEAASESLEATRQELANGSANQPTLSNVVDRN